jgi:alkaline phosphatase
MVLGGGRSVEKGKRRGGCVGAFLCRLFFVFVLLALGAGAAQGQEAKYVVVMIADGWGPKHIEATESYTGGSPVYESSAGWVQRWMSTFPRGGSYSSTLAWSDVEYVLQGTTDSAASGTAMFTGKKTANGRVNVSDDGAERFVTIGEIARSWGKGVGAVTSVPISHGTPASFLSHNDSRGNTFAISDELLFGNPNTTGSVATDPKYGGGHGSTLPSVDVIIGDGRIGYVNSAMRSKLAAESGQSGKHVFVQRQAGIDGGDALWAAANSPNVFKLAGLFDHIYLNDPSYSTENPSLADSARAALAVLEKNANGFVLMVEGGAVDWAGHSNNMYLMIGEMIDFDEAVEAVVDWVEDAGNGSNWSNTLVIVTGDHECGYLTAGPGIFQNEPLGEVSGYTLSLEKLVLGSGGLRASWEDSNNNSVIDGGEVVYWAWNSVGHTNTLVPLYARGAGAELFAEYAVGYDLVRGPYLDNTDVFKVMDEAVPVNQPPTAVDDSATTNQNTAGVIDVVANDADPDGTIDPSTVVITKAPAHGTAAPNADGMVRYTPNAGFVGTDTFQYTVKDNEGATSNEATVAVTVVAVNQPPTAVDDSAATDRNTAVVIDVIANDTDPDGTIDPSTVVITRAPAHGKATANPDGTVTYMPIESFVGTDTFQYTVEDNERATSNEAAATVTVVSSGSPETVSGGSGGGCFITSLMR